MVKKTKSLYLDYTLNGQVKLRCFIAPVPDGFVFGIASPKIGDIHLTVLSKDGKVKTHIKDSTREPAYVLDRGFTPDILAKKVETRVKKWIVPYRGNAIAWVMHPALKRKLKAALTFPVEANRATVPLEAVRAQVVVNFRNPRRWRRIRVRELLTMPNELGFRVERGRVYLVRPIDSGKMLKFTDRQAMALDRLVYTYFGFVEYSDYVGDKVREASRSSDVGGL